MLPVFGPVTTTQSRLLVICNPLLALPNHTSNKTKCSGNVDDETKKSERTVAVRGANGFSLQIRNWDNTKYEEQMFYFNTVQRTVLYPHNVTGVKTSRKEIIHKRQWIDNRPAYESAQEEQLSHPPMLLLTSENSKLLSLDYKNDVENASDALMVATTHLDKVRYLFKRKSTTFPLCEQQEQLSYQQKPA